jgi:hypothetical protein
MASDFRKLEAELARIFRSHGITATAFHGDLYLGICKTSDASGIAVLVCDDDGPLETEVISLTELAREIADFTT